MDAKISPGTKLSQGRFFMSSFSFFLYKVIENMEVENSSCGGAVLVEFPQFILGSTVLPHV